jgi:hypothetical protein
MSYLSDFERSFMDHTLHLVESYTGEYDVTLLLNCLLGLLVLPKEQFLQHIPEDSLSELSKWGISPSSIINPGRPTKTNPRPETLRGLVTNMRHAIAHFNVKPVPPTSAVKYLEYTNESGLKARVDVHEMRAFVSRLAEHLSKQ